MSKRFRFVLPIFFVVLVLSYQNCASDFAVKAEFGESSQGSIDQAAQFTCTDPSVKSAIPSHMLSKKQYQNTIEALFGLTVVNAISTELSTFLEDSNDTDTHERTTQITTQRIEAYERIAKAIAVAVVGNTTSREKIFGACSSVATPVATCIDGYLDTFAKSVYRRPLSDAEKLVARTIANSGGDYKTNLRAVLSLHLQSPFFTWRLELGTPAQTSTTDLTLTQYEIASRISYESADAPPDVALMAAADRNELSNIANVRTHVARLLKTTNGRDKVQRNLMRWALSDKIGNIEALPAALKQDIDTTGLTNAISVETKAYIDHVIFTLNGSFNDLLTSKLSFASHPSLAKIHGHAPTTGSPLEMNGRRQGLLMRTGFLGGSNPRTSLITRGAEFQKRVLCNVIPSPTADIVDLRVQATFTQAELLTKTNREAIEYQTKAPVCMGCHSVINPTGNAFESMDPLGRVRTSEAIFDGATFVRSIPIDATARVPLGDGVVAPVQDAYDLVSFVAGSPRASACFSRNVFRFVYEKEEHGVDSCDLARVHKIVSDPSKPLIEALVELIATEAILTKKMQ